MDALWRIGWYLIAIFSLLVTAPAHASERLAVLEIQGELSTNELALLM